MADGAQVDAGLPADREPTQADLGSIPAGRTFIHFTIVKR
jgi:hypothetical protein